MFKRKLTCPNCKKRITSTLIKERQKNVGIYFSSCCGLLITDKEKIKEVLSNVKDYEKKKL